MAVAPLRTPQKLPNRENRSEARCLPWAIGRFGFVVTNLPRSRPPLELECTGAKGAHMTKRAAIALLAMSFTAGEADAADRPLLAPQLYPAGPLQPVEW
jgi:hypothetical protein